MSSKEPSNKLSTIVTLTLPEPDNEGTLLIQRGDLAHLSQFTYTTDTDFTALIQQALAALAVVESDPPVIPDTLQRKTAPSPAASPEPSEPVIQVPTKSKKGTTAIPIHLLQITGGKADETAQEQALKVAGRLLDSQLWDGKTPIGIDDAPSVLRRLDGLTDKELKVLFKLEQFVQVNPRADEANADPPPDDPADDETPDNPVVEDDQAAAEVLDVLDTADQPSLI
jgi:hypothetical protein